MVRCKILPCTVPSLAADLSRHQRSCVEQSKSEALLFVTGHYSAANDGFASLFLCLTMYLKEAT